MKVEGDCESERTRPVSGFWSALWWRREHSSSDSVSSSGSACTASSFAFLPPAHYAARLQRALTTLSPPTQTYNNRLRERSLRVRKDRDLTLHRKYGLLKEEGIDASTLPVVRRADCGNRQERDRRAASESLQRCAAHVPGKRRAPAPPMSPHPPTSFRKLKRPAPQPPLQSTYKNKENIQIPNRNIPTNLPQMDVQPGQPPEVQFKDENVSGLKSNLKYASKNDASRDKKIRIEKSFLRNLFENKKRNSTIDPAPLKLLPSISELDREAAQIIENSKLLGNRQNSDLLNKASINIGNNSPILNEIETWLCIKCLRRYEAAVNICLHCFPADMEGSNNKGSITNDKNTEKYPNKVLDMEEKQKLKAMLKEMKNSLPKRSKTTNENDTFENKRTSVPSKSEPKSDSTTEAATLKIGSKEKEIPIPGPSVIPTRMINNNMRENMISVSVASTSQNATINYVRTQNHVTENASSKVQDSIHEPLKVSSLLNPVYVPKCQLKRQEKISCIQKNISETSDEKMLSNTDISLPGPSNIQYKPQGESSKAAQPKTTGSAVGQSHLPYFLSEKEASPKTNIERYQKQLFFKSDFKGSTDLKTPVKGLTKKQLTETSNIVDVTSQPSPNRKAEKDTQTTYNPVQQVFPTKCAGIQKVTHNDSSKKEVQTETVETKDNQINNIGIGQSNPHSKRRELINQLEQSIAKGDERLAAEAAVKLAQLRLSCSVLSFSSQIVKQALELQNNISTAETKPERIDPVDTRVSVSGKGKEIVKRQNNTDNNLVLTTKKSDLIATIPTYDKLNIVQDLSKPSTSKEEKDQKQIAATINVWVEDKEAARGPIPMIINQDARMGQLKQQAEDVLGIASHMQRWIVGRTLSADDHTPLVTLAGSDFNTPFYLCLVQSESKKNASPAEENGKINSENVAGAGNVYTELMQLERCALVPNAETFECEVCMEQCMPGRGAVLRDCVHYFCKDCLCDVIRHNEGPIISCPARGCPGILQEREIRALVPPIEYEKWLARGLAAAESGTKNAFHCRTPDCCGWALCDPGVRRFPCPVCNHTNCVTCKAIHEGDTCEQHHLKLQEAMKLSNGLDTSQIDEGTKSLIDALIIRGEALQCPDCSAIITKKWGCDWVKCSACKTEICWVTRGRRWGPGGKGDTSGGCRCGVDGKRCHPSCAYCH